jgi:transposase
MSQKQAAPFHETLYTASAITPSVTYYLGFDVAKVKLDWSLIDERGIEQTHGTVPNKAAEIATLLLTIAGAYPSMCICCVVESTSTYHYPAVDASQAVSLPCVVCNPIVTKQQIKATIRGKKTDRSDAFLVARSGWSGGGRLHTLEPHMATKHYARGIQKLSILSSSFQQYKVHFTELLDGTLTSEAQEVLQDIQQAIQAARKQLYKDLAVSAQGDVFCVLQTIPGIGPYVAASLVGEIQTMERFKTSKALTAFAGLDPKIKQSGHTLNSTGRLTKRGSSYLRRSLFIAANVARQHDPQFKALYEKKRGEGKPFTVATCVVARKLLKVVRSVWLSGRDYEMPEDWG